MACIFKNIKNHCYRILLQMICIIYGSVLVLSDKTESPREHNIIKI